MGVAVGWQWNVEAVSWHHPQGELPKYKLSPYVKSLSGQQLLINYYNIICSCDCLKQKLPEAEVALFFFLMFEFLENLEIL